MAKNRKKVEAYILNLMKTIDPSGFNVKKYQDKFKLLSDTGFDNWMKDIKDGKDKLWLFAPAITVVLKMDDLLEASHQVGAEVFETVEIYDETTERWVTLPHQHLVLSLYTRRLKQTLKSKRSLPDGDTHLNPISGQVVHASKGSAVSLTEAQALDNKGLDSSLVELINVRGGNDNAWIQARSELEETGHTAIKSYVQKSRIKSAVAVRTILTAMNLKNNL